MWSAFKSDLMDFVNTITEDTSKTLTSVIGDTIEDSEENEESVRKMLITDLRRSFGTFSKPVDDIYLKEYEKFSKTFSLSTYASEIAGILDQEIDVARYYAELVPLEMTPELFWSRYFFKLLLIDRNGAMALEDDDDEDLQWESSIENEPKPSTEGSSNENKSSFVNESAGTEIDVLKGQVRALVNRISELERIVASKDQIISKLSAQLASLTKLNNPLQSSLGSLANDPIVGTLTSSSSFTVLENLSDVKSEEIVLSNHPSDPSSSSEASLSEFDTVLVRRATTVESPNAKKLIPRKEVSSSEAITKSLVNLDEEEDDGWS